MQAVFDVNPNSRYRKDFWRRYVIPNRTGAQIALSCLGDWIIFRHTGFRGYIAIARLDDIVADPDGSGLKVAIISQYLPFPSPVPFEERGRYAEQTLRDVLRKIHVGSHLHGHSVRELWPLDFVEIVLSGFRRTLKKVDDTFNIAESVFGLAEQGGLLAGYDNTSRDLRTLLVQRPFRDANFRLEVGARYEYTCAFTKLSLTDGMHFEVDAAHAVSVSDNGPDIVQNGLCAIKTMHWAFDQHLVSIDEAYRPLISSHSCLDRLRPLFPSPGDQIHLPRLQIDYPAQEFLERHRAIFRKKHGM